MRAWWSSWWEKTVAETKWLIKFDGHIKWNCAVATNENEHKNYTVFQVNVVKWKPKSQKLEFLGIGKKRNHFFFYRFEAALTEDAFACFNVQTLCNSGFHCLSVVFGEAPVRRHYVQIDHGNPFKLSKIIRLFYSNLYHSSLLFPNKIPHPYFF